MPAAEYVQLRVFAEVMSDHELAVAHFPSSLLIVPPDAEQESLNVVAVVPLAGVTDAVILVVVEDESVTVTGVFASSVIEPLIRHAGV